MPRLGRDTEVYEDFLGLPLTTALKIKESHTGRETSILHTFYKLDDGSFLAFFEVPEAPFEFKAQEDYDLHIALEASVYDLHAVFERSKAAGMDMRGISDHAFLDSIYLRDPNGFVIELTAKRENHDGFLKTEGKKARSILESWQDAKDGADGQSSGATGATAGTRAGS